MKGRSKLFLDFAASTSLRLKYVAGTQSSHTDFRRNSENHFVPFIRFQNRNHYKN